MCGAESSNDRAALFEGVRGATATDHYISGDWQSHRCLAGLPFGAVACGRLWPPVVALAGEAMREWWYRTRAAINHNVDARESFCARLVFVPRGC